MSIAEVSGDRAESETVGMGQELKTDMLVLEGDSQIINPNEVLFQLQSFLIRPNQHAKSH